MDAVMRFIVFISTLAIVSAESEVVVKTLKGSVVGYLEKSGQIAIFKGLPFATPPIEELRFAPPKEIAPWHPRILNATRYQHACMSNTTQTSSPQKDISEDCLYLNIFADRRCMDSATRCPVIFYIHGGAFFYDSAVMFNDTEIIEKYASKEIIFVIPAYRLGIFGFLDLGADDVVKRNIAFYDLIAALEWMQAEIGSFGGDRNSITLLGHSAGGAASLYLSISPKMREKNLFHRSISLSPSVRWLVDVNRDICDAIIDAVGCKSHSAEATVACLRSKTAVELIEMQRNLESKRREFHGPEVDTHLFPQNWPKMIRTMQKSTISVLIGATRDEFVPTMDSYGECQSNLILAHYEQKATLKMCTMIYKNDLKNDVHINSNRVPGMLPVSQYAMTLRQPGACSHSMRPPDSSHVSADWMHASTFEIASLLQSRVSNVFLYSFDHLNHTRHAQDMPFLIGVHQFSPMTIDDKAIDRIYPQIMVEFARTGRPNRGGGLIQLPQIYWMAFSSRNTNYWSIKHTTFENGSSVGPTLEKYYYPKASRIWLHDLKKIDDFAQVANERKNKFPVKFNAQMDDEVLEVLDGNMTGNSDIPQQRSLTANNNPWHASITIFCSLIAIAILTSLLLLVKWMIVKHPIETRNATSEKTALLRTTRLERYYDMR